jgi:hypothetical protein
MAHLKKSHASFIIILALLVVLPALAQATTGIITVQPEKEVKYPIDLALEDRVLIQFKVVGGASTGETSNTIRFSLVYPNATEKGFGVTGDFSYSFICDAKGDYTLRFVNDHLTEDKIVTLDYEVDHYIFGIPQMLFMVIIIAVVCVVGAAAFIAMSRKP